MELFQKFLNRAGRNYGQVDKNIFGGLLPGGAASIVSPIKQRIKSTVETNVKNLAGTAMNQLPDRANLFARYITGVGNTNLQLKPETLMDLRAAASQPPMARGMVPNPFKVPDEILTSMQQQLKTASPETINSPLGNFIKQTVSEGIKNKDLPDFITGPIPAYGPGIVESGPVRPYGRPDIGRGVTNTLGSYNVDVDPGKTITFKDTYDMVNPGEDPDLVSGKFQPIKALEEIQSIWDPTKGYFASKAKQAGQLLPTSPKGYGQMRETKSQFASPATALGRALLYALPIKPTPYNVNITVPY
jgi:hypothetical protein